MRFRGTFWAADRRKNRRDKCHRLAGVGSGRIESLKMPVSATIRKILTVFLGLTIALWAEAGLALVQGDQVMQCSMSAHDIQAMGDMPCCPGDGMQSPATSGERPPCCAVNDAPERPLGFVVSSARAKPPALDLVAVLPASPVASAAQIFGVWRSTDQPGFLKPVLELKTDLRI